MSERAERRHTLKAALAAEAALFVAAADGQRQQLEDEEAGLAWQAGQAVPATDPSPELVCAALALKSGAEGQLSVHRRAKEAAYAGARALDPALPPSPVRRSMAHAWRASAQSADPIAAPGLLAEAQKQTAKKNADYAGALDSARKSSPAFAGLAAAYAGQAPTARDMEKTHGSFVQNAARRAIKAEKFAAKAALASAACMVLAAPTPENVAAAGARAGAAGMPAALRGAMLRSGALLSKAGRALSETKAKISSKRLARKGAAHSGFAGPLWLEEYEERLRASAEERQKAQKEEAKAEEEAKKKRESEQEALFAAIEAKQRQMEMLEKLFEQSPENAPAAAAGPSAPDSAKPVFSAGTGKA